MKGNSTLSDLFQNSQIKKKNSEKRLVVREGSIKMLLNYSKSLKNIKTSSIGDVLIVNN
ncbi:MAG: hypothetical protein HOA52_03215 [Flavobacteriales bacterium]|jgi:hypothetical protein|nr:hypothetical protein [Flavobacteriales bacterium]MBT6808481.1 hypothetical protein [Flavobacteriales bacterium]